MIEERSEFTKRRLIVKVFKFLDFYVLKVKVLLSLFARIFIKTFLIKSVVEQERLVCKTQTTFHTLERGCFKYFLARYNGLVIRYDVIENFLFHCSRERKLAELMGLEV